jgi:hypothetical protein
MLSRGYPDDICELILFGRYSISFVGAIPWFSLEHDWNLVFDNLRTNGSARALVTSFPFIVRINVSTTHALPLPLPLLPFEGPFLSGDGWIMGGSWFYSSAMVIS